MMRERLIELLVEKASYGEILDGYARRHAEEIADHLLANGVLCPPCKVGDEFYMADQCGNINAWIVYDFTYDSTYSFMIHLSRKDDTTIVYTGISNDIGNILFSSYKEAAQALKEGRGDILTWMKK